jgi:hypothetical protein
MLMLVTYNFNVIYLRNLTLTEAHVVIRLLLLFFLLLGSGFLSSTTGSGATSSSSRSSSTSGTNVHEETSEVLASESLGIEGEPDGLNFDTSGLDKGGELVGLISNKKKNNI